MSLNHELIIFFLLLFCLGLSPSTQYRVTVRAKQLRAPGQQQPPPVGPPPEEAPGAYTDFRTLAKGLPDPPQVTFISIKYLVIFLLRYYII